MGIKVDIPILIRTDPSSLRDAPEAVVATVRDALARALARSRAEVLDRTGGYLGVKLAAPRLRWTGRDASRVAADDRERLQAWLTNMLHDEARASGLFEQADAFARAADPLSRPAEEQLSDNRLDRMLRRYRVPSYEGGSEWLHVDYRSRAAHDGLSISWGTHSGRPLLQLATELGYRLPGHDELYADYPELQSIPEGGAFGFIGMSETASSGAPLWVLAFTKDRGKTWDGFDFNGFFEQHPDDDGNLKPEQKPPPVGNAIANWIPKPQSTLEGVTLMNRHFGAGIRQAVSRKLDALEGQIRAEDRAAAMDQTVGFFLNKLWDDLGKADALLSVDFSSRSLLLAVSAGVAARKWEGDAYLLPLYRLAPASGADGGSAGGTKRKGGAGQGQAGGKGPGRAGPGEGGAEPGSKPYYPKAELAMFADKLVCESFEDELPIDDLPGAERIKALMETIAFRLQIDYCGYAANFCIGAAMAVSARARGVGQHAAEDESAAYYTDPARAGNLGILQFVPTVSPAIRTMRYLAETCGMLDVLRGLIDDYAKEHRADLFPADHPYDYDKNPAGWCLRLLEAYHSEISDSVADIFKMTCRILMLQMLKSSHAAIRKRLDHFREYLPFFEMLMTTMFQRDGELDHMRDALQRHVALKSIGIAKTAQGADPAEAWTSASNALVAMLTGTHSLSAVAGKEGAFVEGPAGPRIIDSMGIAWTLEEIEVARVFARGQAEDIDPLVKQLSDIPELMETFRSDRGSLGYALYTKLREMIANNQEQESLVKEDWEHAFKASPIIEHTPTATVIGSKVVLGGIHLEAHKQIGEFFRGHSCYPAGLNAAFDAELGKRSLKHAIELSSTVALSIMCPPVGLGFGVAASVHEIRNAYRQERLYGSFINPDLIISQAQVELELYTAWLGAILNVLPEIGSFVLKPLTAGLKSGLAEGVSAELKATAQEWAAAEKYMMRNAAEEAAEAVAGQFVDHFAVALVSAAAIEQVVGEAVSPIANYAMEQLELSHSVGGSAGAQALIDRVIQRYERESQEPMTW